MDLWEWNLVEWTKQMKVSIQLSSGLAKLAEIALLVPVWEYLALALILTSIWLYRTLDFHFVEDLLHGFRGEVPRLHHSSTSKLMTEILSKCKILKERYFSTPWLSSPHLQTAFLHFNGRPPPIKYHRQLYITPDRGTIALDWVKPPLSRNEEEFDFNERNAEHDETPIVILIPGLTSDSKDPYLKHMAHRSVMMGWRTLVSNHRGLGGVTITSDQFYNAGWTEDLRRIINYVHEKYPKAPIFTVGTSIGANILDLESTIEIMSSIWEKKVMPHPWSAAAAVCNPWDLLVGDRFISRKRVQKLYNRALAIGLLEYAKMHQSALGRIADWSLVSKTKTVRDFDHYCTRHTGKYETVDTYYRRCSSADFLTKVAVPLLCFSSLDDPVCTKEAIPWDEILANPNVAVVVTKHGGHLAFFEGLTARTIWWTRALTEYMTFMIPSHLMHTSQKVSAMNGIRTSGELDVDKGPYLSVSTSGFVAAEELQPSSPMTTGQDDNIKVSDVIVESEEGMDNRLQDENATPSRGPGAQDGPAEPSVVTLTFKDISELTSLQSALLQLLQQLRHSPSVTQEPGCISNQNNVETNAENVTIKALRESTLRAIEVPVSPTVMFPLKKCREVATKLPLSGKSEHSHAQKDGEFGSGPLRSIFSQQASSKKKTLAGSDQHTPDERVLNVKGFLWLVGQSKRTFWLLTCVALVTSCPWIGSAIFLWWRRRFVTMSNRLKM